MVQVLFSEACKLALDGVGYVVREFALAEVAEVRDDLADFLERNGLARRVIARAVSIPAPPRIDQPLPPVAEPPDGSDARPPKGKGKGKGDPTGGGQGDPTGGQGDPTGGQGDPVQAR